MAPTGGGDQTALSPADAFNALSNKTRINILRILSEADEPLSFTELRTQVGIKRGAEFNYHLEKLLGHFVEKTEDGYALRIPGSRVVQAVLSGTVGEDPIVKPTTLDQECYHCGAPVMIMYRGHLSVYCTNCPANFEIPVRDVGKRTGLDSDSDEMGLLRGFQLPPAGIQDRSSIELLQAGNAWANLERIASGLGLCPRCSAQIEASIEVCETHNRDGGTCDECGSRHAVTHIHECTNCNYVRVTQFGWVLLANTDVLNFFTSHGINPIGPDSPMSMRAVLDSYDEEVISIDPFKGRFTFTIDDDTLTLTVDDDLNVVDVTQSTIADTG